VKMPGTVYSESTNHAAINRSTREITAADQEAFDAVVAQGFSAEFYKNENCPGDDRYLIEFPDCEKYALYNITSMVAMSEAIACGRLLSMSIKKTHPSYVKYKSIMEPVAKDAEVEAKKLMSELEIKIYKLWKKGCKLPALPGSLKLLSPKNLNLANFKRTLRVQALRRVYSREDVECEHLDWVIKKAKGVAQLAKLVALVMEVENEQMMLQLGVGREELLMHQATEQVQEKIKKTKDTKAQRELTLEAYFGPKSTWNIKNWDSSQSTRSVLLDSIKECEIYIGNLQLELNNLWRVFNAQKDGSKNISTTSPQSREQFIVLGESCSIFVA